MCNPSILETPATTGQTLGSLWRESPLDCGGGCCLSSVMSSGGPCLLGTKFDPWHLDSNSVCIACRTPDTCESRVSNPGAHRSVVARRKTIIDIVGSNVNWDLNVWISGH
uniref:Uncharacterized protein n=1 Tax=Cannabis sativa TaxID=3483 RepID=A0A803PJP5_CANSA